MTLRVFTVTFLIVLFVGCSPKWQDVIQYGSIDKEDFHEILKVELRHGLIIVPIKLKGKTYRFLFDSGAPQSISEELQEEFNFKVVSSGNIKDTDNHRLKVNYVSVDTLHIGSIPFLDQTAFVTSFKSSPMISCLKLDGIIGSNLMRYCNWKIDYAKAELHLSNTTQALLKESSIKIPFRPDQQYDINIDLKIGSHTLQNLKVDYGSNGSLSLPNHVFNTLKQKQHFETFRESGTKQSGLFGKPTDLTREIAYADTLIIGNIEIHNVEFRSGGSGLIGHKILSRFIIIIDWENKFLFLEPVSSSENINDNFGFKAGYTLEKGIYIQSVTEFSDAALKGVIPDMKILRVDELDFTQNQTFCDFVNYMENSANEIIVHLQDQHEGSHTVSLKKSVPKK